MCLTLRESVWCIYGPAKLVLQDACRLGTGWVDPLDPVLLERWSNWASTLDAINGLSIPRCFNNGPTNVKGYELHLFSDASKRVFGAIAYLRLIRADGTYSTAFIMAKSCLAKITYQSIHRKELNGALQAVRLAILIQGELRLSIISTTFWTDSVTVLRWIHSSTC